MHWLIEMLLSIFTYKAKGNRKARGKRYMNN